MNFINSFINTPENTVSSVLSQFSVTNLLSDLNNYKEIFDFTARGWVGPDPLLTNFYIFQPPLRNGVYIPNQLVRKIQLPDRDIETKTIKFRGSNINFAKGSKTGQFTATFYENQDLQITSFFEAWKSYTVAPAGGYYGLPNNYKFNMFVVLNNSLTPGNSTITRQITSNLPIIFNEINFSGAVIIFGAFPIALKYPPMSTPTDGKVDSVQLDVVFECDECLKIPLNITSLDMIMEILGLSRNGIVGSVENFIKNEVSNFF